MKQIMFSAIALFAMTLLSSCQKDVIEGRFNTLTHIQDWKLSKLETYDSSSSQWMPSAISDCAKDNFHSFYESGLYEYNFGAVKCVSFEPGKLSGDWKLTDDEEHILFRVSSIGQYDTMGIAELTTKKFVGISSDDQGKKYRGIYIPN
jgi:hypothetical protein